MAKNLLRAMIKASNRTPGRINTQEVIEKIESGYLVNDRDTFKTKKSFSPSTLVYGHGACPRYWYLAFHGAEFNDVVTPHQVANMRNGSLAHERIQQAIADAGILVTKEKKIVHSDPPIFGYCDAEILWNDAIVPCEIKTTNDMSFVKRKESATALSYHIAQLLMYMHIEDHDMGLIIYENKNTHDLYVLPVEMNQHYRDWISYLFGWCRDVKAASDQDMLPNKLYRSNSKVCKTCPIAATCKALPTLADVEIPLLEPLE